MQSRVSSFIETIANVTIGWFIALITQIIVFPLFNINIPIKDNLLISAIFTAVAIIRGYTLRRIFNYIVMRKMLRNSKG